MVDKSDTPNESEPIELIEPAETDEVILDESDVEHEPEELVEPTTHIESGEAREGETVVESAETPVEAHPVAEAATETSVASEGEKSPSLDGSSAQVQTVYVTAPIPPKKKGNRGMGILLSILAAIVFGAVYLGVAALLILFVKPGGVTDAISTFVVGPVFYLPAAIFLVLMILWVLLVNRAGWSAWVIGSLIIAAITYFASIGALLLMAGGFGLTADDAIMKFREWAVNPAIIAAALLAREVAIWFGAVIAARGRRVRARNEVARDEFEREEAEKRAEIGGRTAH